MGYEKVSKDMDEATKVEVINCDEEIDELRRRVRYLTRKVNRLEQQTNRVKNLVPGRGRIFKLDHVAMLLEHDADMCEADGTDLESVATSRDLATFIRRLAWDLGKMRDAVRGDTRRAISNRNDPTQWVGPRP